MNVFKIILIFMLVISVAQAADPTRYESGFILWGSGINGYNQIIYNATLDQRNLTVNDTELVFDMRFNENGTGSAISAKIYDSSKYSNDGTWFGSTAPNWTGGVFGLGNALNFDGTNDYVDVGNSQSLNIVSTITLGAWVKTSTATSDRIIAKETADYNTPYLLYITSGTFAFYTSNSAPNAFIQAATPLTYNDSAWHYVVSVYDGNNAKIFVDGDLKATSGSWTRGLKSSTEKTLIGATMLGGSPGYFFNGTLKNVRIWNRSLSADEIKILYYSNPLNEKSSFVQTDNFRVVNSSGKTTFNVSNVQTTVFNSIIPDKNVTNATLDIGAVGKSFNRVYAATFAGGDFADKAPGGYNYTGLWSWTVQYDVNGTEIGRIPNIPQDIKYATVKLNPINGNWELAQGFGSIESTAIIPNDNDLIVDGRLIILGGYKAQVYGNITIGDKLIVSNRAGVLTNARGLTVPTLQYDAAWLWKNLPVSTDPTQYNRYNSAQGVSATIVAIALESYNSNNTGLIKVKVFNT